MKLYRLLRYLGRPASLALLLAFLFSGSALADCIDYGDYLHWEGSAGTEGPASAVAVAGSYAYVACLGFEYMGRLLVIDVSNPASPKIVGRVATPGQAWDVAVAGSYAYVADGESGLQVI